MSQVGSESRSKSSRSGSRLRSQSGDAGLARRTLIITLVAGGVVVAGAQAAPPARS